MCITLSSSYTPSFIAYILALAASQHTLRFCNLPKIDFSSGSHPKIKEQTTNQSNEPTQMATLMKQLSAAVSKILSKAFATAVAAEYDIPQEDFSKFMEAWLANEGSKKGSTSTKKGKATGRVNGYNLFSKEARSKDKSLDFKAIGALWKALSDDQKATWKAKADDLNASKKATESDSESEVQKPNDSKKEKSAKQAKKPTPSQRKVGLLRRPPR